MNLELTSILFLQQFSNPVFDLIAVFFALFLNFISVSVFFLIIYFIHRRKKFFSVLVGIAGSGIVVLIIKNLVQRLRPGLDILPAYISYGASYSYPSGHTALAFVIAFILSNKFPKHTFLLYSAAIMAGISRIYLGVHYPTDVLSGAIVGIICGIIVINLNKPINKLEQKINKRLNSIFK